jgi:NitT/TauT family transport system substrate-binding protein
MKSLTLSFLLIMTAVVMPAAAQTTDKITVGYIPLLSSAPLHIASAKGYFRDAGLEVDFEPIESTGNAMPLLATNRTQVLVGGLSAAYWNALSSDLPVIMAFDSASSPVYSDAVVRADLAGVIKSAKDLKGRSISANAPGSIPIYQLAKLLETANLSLADVNVKYIGMPQMTLGLINQAVDVALMSPPLNRSAVQQKAGVHWLDFDDIIKPQPMELAVYTANADWMKTKPDQARKFFLSIGRAVRDYCQAYHHGPERNAIEEIIVKGKLARDIALLESTPWQTRDVNGHINVASAEDIQAVFFKEGLAKKKFPGTRLVDDTYAAYVEKQLGPFALANPDSKEPRCR